MRKQALLCCAMLMATVALSAAEQGGQVRSVMGHVVNAQDQPLSKAVVHLKNTRTLAIKTYITEPDGSYRFSALSPNIDYELYAEYQGAHSDTKTLSAFDNRKQVTMTLKIRK